MTWPTLLGIIRGLWMLTRSVETCHVPSDPTTSLAAIACAVRTGIAGAQHGGSRLHGRRCGLAGTAMPGGSCTGVDDIAVRARRDPGLATSRACFGEFRGSVCASPVRQPGPCKLHAGRQRSTSTAFRQSGPTARPARCSGQPHHCPEPHPLCPHGGVPGSRTTPPASLAVKAQVFFCHVRI